jgi:hypothetical protein
LQPKNATKGSRARKKTNISGGNVNGTTKHQQQQPQPPPPSSPKKATPPKIKEEKHFPALVDPPVVDNIQEKVSQSAKTLDAASTTTATSSTTSSTAEIPKGGYAAALLKAPTPTMTTSTSRTTTSTKASNFVATCTDDRT